MRILRCGLVAVILATSVASCAGTEDVPEPSAPAEGSTSYTLSPAWLVTVSRQESQSGSAVCFVGGDGEVTVKDDKGEVVATASRATGGSFLPGSCDVGGSNDPQGPIYLQLPDRPSYVVTTGNGCSKKVSRDEVMELESEDRYFMPCD